MTNHSLAPLLVAASVALLTPSAVVAQAPSPREHLGFEVGADRQLADWGQIVGYFARLAAASPEVIGVADRVTGRLRLPLRNRRLSG